MPLIGILLLVILSTPIQVQSGKPPCPKGIGGSLDTILNHILPAVMACPPTLWAKTYGGGGPRSVQQTSDGGFIVAGTKHPATSLDDFWLLRLDADGNVVWQKTYSGTETDTATSVDLTSDGGFIVAGLTASFGVSYGAGGSGFDLWLLRLDGNGNVVWQKTYGGVSSEGASDPSVRTMSDGGFVVAGSTLSFGAGSYDFWLLRLEANGNIAWQRTYGGLGSDDGRSVQPTSDGGFIVAGATQSFGADAVGDVWVIRLDANGNVVWQRTYGGSAGDGAHAVQPTSDGGFIVFGNTESFGAGLTDVLVLKLDGNGNVLWQKTYGGVNKDRVWSGQSGQITSDGGFIVAGSTNYLVGTGGEDMWLLRLEGNGNVVWQKTYGVQGDDRAFSAQVTSDGGLIVGGSGGRVLRLDANGSLSASCSLGQASTAVSMNSALVTNDTSALAFATFSAATVTATGVPGVNSSGKVSVQCS